MSGCWTEKVSCTFKDTGDKDFLFGALCLGSTPFHVTAIRVEPGTTCAADPSMQGRIDAIMEMDEGVDDGYELYQRDGHDYFVIMYPYQT